MTVICQNTAHGSANTALWISGDLKKGQGFEKGSPTFKMTTGYNFKENIDNYVFIFLLRIIVKHIQNLTSKTRNVRFNFLYHARLQPSSEVLMKLFFWVVMQRILTVAYRHFGHPIGSSRVRQTENRDPWICDR